jgi:hypothetical protein
MRHFIEFESGDTTCAVEPGKFCRFASSKSFGSKPFCTLFQEYIYPDANGWLARTPSCMSIYDQDEERT